MSEFAIETFDLTRNFNGFLAVDHINIKIKKGELFGLLGPNGAGKTTMLNMLCTLLKPSAGTAKVNGFDIIDQASDVRKSIGIVFQDPSLDDRLTGRENLEMHAMLYGIGKEERERRINEVLKLVELEEKADLLVRTYSGGMKRRLEIARGLVHYPNVLFLDEPTLGLDPQTREHIWEYIEELKKKHAITIILTTHYMDEADRLCDRIGIIDHGKIIAIGTPNELKNKVGGDVIVIETKSKNVNKFEKLKFMGEVRITNNGILLNVKNGERLITKIVDFARKNRIKVDSISLRKPSLNDVFLHYTGRVIREEEVDGKELMRQRFLMRMRRGT
ncbi:MAG: ATP-binding cassette domain-containing protein [Candidatus Nanoarchaeia archaeon]|nr:ATP-binding cassette domain-containing protein [Candidatus Jingweiarchaeum tengchongense]